VLDLWYDGGRKPRFTEEGTVSNSDDERPRKKRTIVGGRPRGKTKPGAKIPRGVELMLKMAAIDPTFRARLIHMRGTASKTIGLELAFSEAMILEAVPEDQLQAMIDAMPVSDDERDALRSLAPETRLPSDSPLLASMGIRPGGVDDVPPAYYQTRGLGTDLPPRKPPSQRSKGIRPDKD
jgi:hypothetical protein